MRRVVLAVLLALAAAACVRKVELVGSDGHPDDASGPDGTNLSPPDAAFDFTPDASIPDAAFDATIPDAAPPDA